jgi:hypothetical protein
MDKELIVRAHSQCGCGTRERHPKLSGGPLAPGFDLRNDLLASHCQL